MTHLSLFTGIGGLDLAAEWAGFETVGQCEWAEYPTKVLEKHWPDVPRWRDIRTLTKESFYERTGRTTVDVISGGFPCQPFSVAGKQKGKGDDRYLWPEMLRVIRELAPRWVIGENVPGILKIAGRTVCEDLEREGYAVAVFNFEAAAVGAPHRRERVFFVAHSYNYGDKQLGESRQGISAGAKNTKKPGSGFQYPEQHYQCNPVSKRITADVADTSGILLQGQHNRQGQVESGRESWWSTEPDVGRVASRIPDRVDRLKCLGNAVVPQQAYPIFKAIAEVPV